MRNKIREVKMKWNGMIWGIEVGKRHARAYCIETDSWTTQSKEDLKDLPVWFTDRDMPKTTAQEFVNKALTNSVEPSVGSQGP